MLTLYDMVSFHSTVDYSIIDYTTYDSIGSTSSQRPACLNGELAATEWTAGMASPEGTEGLHGHISRRWRVERRRNS